MDTPYTKFKKKRTLPNQMNETFTSVRFSSRAEMLIKLLDTSIKDRQKINKKRLNIIWQGKKKLDLHLFLPEVEEILLLINRNTAS